ncbi:MAG: type II/IV secretion system protein, partial [Proteobacteria bacterium]|nr:type II/IV secretion system protein [Pseudomonadota bacterium]
MDAAVHSESKPPMDIGHLAAARQKAFEQGVSVIQILEESGAYTPDELIRQLGQLLHMPMLDMKAIHALNPAFDILP